MNMKIIKILECLKNIFSCSRIVDIFENGYISVSKTCKGKYFVTLIDVERDMYFPLFEKDTLYSAVKEAKKYAEKIRKIEKDNHEKD